MKKTKSTNIIINPIKKLSNQKALSKSQSGFQNLNLPYSKPLTFDLFAIFLNNPEVFKTRILEKIEA